MMKDNNIKISVVTVCYNAVKGIEQTILSIIEQTYDNIEYIVIDGGSTDGTVDIIKKYAEVDLENAKYNHGISYWISEPDKGIYDAMNKGIKVASGNYVIFINAFDTFYEQTTIKNAVNSIHDLNTLYYGDVMMISSIQRKKYGGIFSKYRLTYENICHQSIFYPAGILKENQFNLRYKILSDWHINLKLWSKIPFIYIHSIIANYLEGGVSNIQKDSNFNKDHKRLTLKYLGILPFLFSYLYSCKFRFIQHG